MEKLHKIFIRVCLVILPAMIYVQSQQPSGYIGCYDQDAFRKITTKIVTRLNNGTYCITSCKSYEYRYAGTQVQTCKCGKKLLVGSQQSTCKIKCPGQRSELCGGEESMSVYDISLIPDTEDSSLVLTTSVTTTSVPTTSVSTTAVPTTTVSTTTVSTTTVPTTTVSTPSVSATSVPTTTVQTTSVSATTVHTTSLPTASLQTNSLPTNSLPTTLVPTTQFYQHTGKTTDGSVSAYISVSILVVVVVAIILVVMILLQRKRHRNGEQCTCFGRKKMENYSFQASTNKTYNANSLNDDDSCFRYSSENVQNSSTNMYAEIAFGSIQSIAMSENTENVHSTFSIGVPKGRYEAGTTEPIGTYDTLQTFSKAKTIKISDCSQSAYDHVIVGNHNNQASGTDEYSHIGAVQINNVQQTHFRIKDNQSQIVNRSDINSADCRDQGRSGRSSADCSDQDDKSYHEYVILEPL